MTSSRKDRKDKEIEKKYSRRNLYLTAIGILVSIGIPLISTFPNFQEPRYRFVTYETYISMLRNQTVWYVDKLSQLLKEEYVFEQSLIEMVEIKPDDSIAASNVEIFCEIYVNDIFYSKNKIAKSLKVNQQIESMYLSMKSFDKDRLIYIPISVTGPLDTTREYYSPEELNNSTRILIQYKPIYIEYTNSRWQHIPILRNIRFKTPFTGMKASIPILIDK